MASPPSDDNNSALVARRRAGDNAEPLTITEISQTLKRTVEDQFGYIRVRGEISRVSRPRSGHVYTTLKDERANLDAIIWKGNVSRLAFAPEEGLEVIATGKLTTYPGQSKYQIVIDSLELAGEGALLALLEKTRLRLEAEGLFAPERKRRLPFLPRTIGVVTSPTGSVIRDILHRLADRFPSHVLVWPVLVQGQGAAEQVAAAIRGFSGLQTGGPVARPDVVIIARGGGSIEDLWSFNEEMVVRAITECTIPVISAVGHETDTTLADHAADRRAPTPTAAAEIAVPVRADLAATLDDFAARQRRAVHRPVELGRERLNTRIQRMPRIEALLQPQAQRLDELAERLRRGLIDQASQGRHDLAGVQSRLAPRLLENALINRQRALANVRLTPALVERPISASRDRLTALARLAGQLHPKKPLERGYAIVRNNEGEVMTARAKAAAHGELTLEFKDGEMSVGVGDSPPVSAASTPSPKKPRGKTGSPQQDDLFG